jgi:indole-3-acetate monooxygenase
MTTTPTIDAPTATTAVPLTGDEILARATALAPRLRERSEEIERERRLPADIVDALRATGVFGMGYGPEWGGPVVTSMRQTEIIEALAYGDASAGWCAMIGMDTGLHAAFLAPSVAREMFAGMDVITAGLLFPIGRAERVDGGYRLSGRWQFGSGINHCDWVISGTYVYRDGQPEPGPNGDPHDSCFMMVPRDQVEIIDTWHTTGLAGSGSCDYTITDVFVPEERAFRFDAVRGSASPLAQPEAFMRNMPGVPLGVARAALDHVRDLAATRVHPGTGAAWADDWRMQTTLADCEADLTASRAGVYATMRRQWEVLSTGGTLDDLTADERAALPLARLHAFRTARSIVNRLYDLLQTGAIYRRSPMDRWLRDTTTMCQHIVAQDRILQSAGAHLLGGTPGFPLCLGITG